jgi:hypothetical protein
MYTDANQLFDSTQPSQQIYMHSGNFWLRVPQLNKPNDIN